MILRSSDIDSWITRMKNNHYSNSRLANLYNWLNLHAKKHWKKGGKLLHEDIVSIRANGNNLKTGIDLIKTLEPYADPEKPALSKKINYAINAIKSQPSGVYDIPGAVKTPATYGLYKLNAWHHHIQITEATDSDLINFLTSLRTMISNTKYSTMNA